MKKPDLCVSGINHGSNSSINVIYSGTMSAAIEASIEGVPAIGFSLLDYSWKADFSEIKNIIKNITLKSLSNGIPKGTALNVNFPKMKEKAIKGIKICNQANAYWIEKFDKRINPQGREYYWLTGEFINNDKSIESDEWALNNGFVSIVPVKFDLTNHEVIEKIKSWNL
jgi:5'-nucleotidase